MLLPITTLYYRHSPFATFCQQERIYPNHSDSNARFALYFKQENGVYSGLLRRFSGQPFYLQRLELLLTPSLNESLFFDNGLWLQTVHCLVDNNPYFLYLEQKTLSHLTQLLFALAKNGRQDLHFNYKLCYWSKQIKRIKITWFFIDSYFASHGRESLTPFQIKVRQIKNSQNVNSVTQTLFWQQELGNLKQQLVFSNKKAEKLQSRKARKDPIYQWKPNHPKSNWSICTSSKNSKRRSLGTEKKHPSTSTLRDLTFIMVKRALKVIKPSLLSSEKLGRNNAQKKLILKLAHILRHIYTCSCLHHNPDILCQKSWYELLALQSRWSEKQVYLLSSIMALSNASLFPEKLRQLVAKNSHLAGDSTFIKKSLYLHKMCSKRSFLPLTVSKQFLAFGLYHTSGFLGLWNPTAKAEMVDFRLSPDIVEPTLISQALDYWTEKRIPWHWQGEKLQIGLGPLEIFIAVLK